MFGTGQTYLLAPGRRRAPLSRKKEQKLPSEGPSLTAVRHSVLDANRDHNPRQATEQIPSNSAISM